MVVLANGRPGADGRSESSLQPVRTEKIPYAIKRYVDETARLYGVLDRRLADRAFVAGEAYSIADMAIYPWIVSHKWQSQRLEDFPHLHRWFNRIKERPATVRAYELVQKVNPPKS